jgi:transposase
MDGHGYSTLDVRVRAVEAVLKGMPVSQTATTFGVDRTTLHRWLARYDRDGETGLQRLPVSGRPRKLNRFTGKRLKRIVLAPATKFGFDLKRIYGPSAVCILCWLIVSMLTFPKTLSGDGCVRRG